MSVVNELWKYLLLCVEASEVLANSSSVLKQLFCFSSARTVWQCLQPRLLLHSFALPNQQRVNFVSFASARCRQKCVCAAVAAIIAAQYVFECKDCLRTCFFRQASTNATASKSSKNAHSDDTTVKSWPSGSHPYDMKNGDKLFLRRFLRNVRTARQGRWLLCLSMTLQKNAQNKKPSSGHRAPA